MAALGLSVDVDTHLTPCTWNVPVSPALDWMKAVDNEGQLQSREHGRARVGLTSKRPSRRRRQPPSGSCGCSRVVILLRSCLGLFVPRAKQAGRAFLLVLLTTGASTRERIASSIAISGLEMITSIGVMRGFPEGPQQQQVLRPFTSCLRGRSAVGWYAKHV